MEYHLIINPQSAGGKTGQRVASITDAAVDALGEGEVSITKYKGHATELTRSSLRNGVKHILVAGGDGTINEVVNGFFEGDDLSKMIVPEPCLGVIPSGSGSDFCRSIDVDDSLAGAIGRIAKNEPKLIDLGRVEPADGEPRIFANIASVGISAEIGQRANQLKWLKKISGLVAFNWAIVRSAIGHRCYPLEIRSSDRADGEAWDANCVAICNGQYFGSGVRVAREADLSSKCLEMVIVHDHGPAGFLKGVSQIKRDDTSSPRGVTKSRSGEWVEIACSDPTREVLIEADGESGGRLPARFVVLPGVVRLY